MHNIKSLLFKISVDKYPNNKLNNIPPINERPAFSIPALRGVTIGTIVKNNIPIPKERIIDNHNLCLAITAASTKIATKIITKNIFASILITTL